MYFVDTWHSFSLKRWSALPKCRNLATMRRRNFGEKALLALVMITTSYSPYPSGVVMALKKGSAMRFCCTLWQLIDAKINDDNCLPLLTNICHDWAKKRFSVSWILPQHYGQFTWWKRILSKQLQWASFFQCKRISFVFGNTTALSRTVIDLILASTVPKWWHGNLLSSSQRHCH